MALGLLLRRHGEMDIVIIAKKKGRMRSRTCQTTRIDLTSTPRFVGGEAKSLVVGGQSTRDNVMGGDGGPGDRCGLDGLDGVPNSPPHR